MLLLNPAISHAALNLSCDVQNGTPCRHRGPQGVCEDKIDPQINSMNLSADEHLVGGTSGTLNFVAKTESNLKIEVSAYAMVEVYGPNCMNCGTDSKDINLTLTDPVTGVSTSSEISGSDAFATMTLKERQYARVHCFISEK